MCRDDKGCFNSWEQYRRVTNMGVRLPEVGILHDTVAADVLTFTSSPVAGSGTE